MKLAASYGDIRLMAPDDAAASFFKSPFRAHETGSAVDIAYGDFGSPASSPVDGVIVDIREFETPTPFRDRNFKEYLTAVRCGRLIVRILHVKPDLGIGEHRIVKLSTHDLHIRDALIGDLILQVLDHVVIDVDCVHLPPRNEVGGAS